MSNTSATGAVLDCAGRVLDLRTPKVMGVLNLTPDSFSDGGELYRDSVVDLDALCRRAEAMVTAGAAVLDIGGESTRPGAKEVPESEELDRVIGALTAILPRFDVIVSLDTSTPAVMREGARQGAGMINDVRALRREGALAVAATSGLPVCLMHMQGKPRSMQDAPQYDDVVSDVMSFLKQRCAAAEMAGIEPDKILVDPGFGFGKSPGHNFELLRRLGDFAELGKPVLAGLSRKSMIKAMIDRGPTERSPSSLALAVLAADRGARLLRVHDVAATSDALAMVTGMETIKP